jgi:5-(aminomethyl)-3-furanmethanol phosphate kinase
MWVIKLGGSLLSSGSLKEWLSIIVEFGAGKLVIVPGGGIFADQVRDAQQKWKFDDQAAHQMALLAMEQYAHLLQSYAPALSLSNSIEGIEKAINLNRVPVWLPFKIISSCQDVSANWNLTSDSLALWLAGHLNAEHTILVKSLSASNMNARQLSESEMVDKDFPEFVKTSESTIWWLEQNDVNTLKNLFKKNGNPEDYLSSVAY